jgi:outer membrane protein assembly factor BamD
VLRKPDTVTAAQIGDPPLEDATPTYAPAVVKSLQGDYVAALYPKAPGPIPTRPAVPKEPEADNSAPTPPPPASTAPPTLSDVPTAGDAAVDNTTNTMTETAPATPGATVGGANASMGVEVLTPGAVSTNNVAPPSSLPAATGAPDPNYGLPSVHPKDATALPPVEKPSEAPDQVNEVEGKPQPAVQQAQNPNSRKKKKAPAVDKSDESSSKKKPKKGLDKLNPF